MFSEILKKNRSSLFLLLVMLLLPVSVSSGSIFYLSRYEDTIQQFSFSQWLLFYCITALTMALALTPTTFIALVTGYFLGWNGLYGLVPSYLCASLLGYMLAWGIDRGNFFEQIRANKKVDGLMENLRKDEFWVIFFCRLSPALPFAMMNVFLSFMKVKMKNYVGGSLFGMLPRTLLSVWIGTQANDILRMLKGKEEPDAGKFLVIFLLVFSVLGLYWLVMRAVKSRTV
ncbi:MAG TPA: VTT domain-containing protein [Cytophagaceae bacterium]|nr:VTT domain-containing protein [Cytophagaceae bacterium]